MARGQRHCPSISRPFFHDIRAAPRPLIFRTQTAPIDGHDGITSSEKRHNSHSTKEMSLPARPPIPAILFWTPCMAPLTAGPAAEVTLDRPCEALEATLEAESFDLAAALEATSAVEACRRACWRAKSRVCRSTRRDVAGADIKESREKIEVVALVSED